MYSRQYAFLYFNCKKYTPKHFIVLALNQNSIFVQSIMIALEFVCTQNLATENDN